LSAFVCRKAEEAKPPKRASGYCSTMSETFSAPYCRRTAAVYAEPFASQSGTTAAPSGQV
jgi:hypothetical protein